VKDDIDLILKESPRDCDLHPFNRAMLLHPDLARTSARHVVADYYFREIGFEKLRTFIAGMPPHGLMAA
jgi:hypothetical protein